MIRSFAKAAVLVSAVALLVGCDETKPTTGDAEAPKASSSAAATPAVNPTATVTATATASASAGPTDAGAAEVKDAGHDAAKPAPKK